MRMIDPPMGWAYGFPKRYNPLPDETMEIWLVRNGYPRKEIESYGDYFHVRFWDEVDKTQEG